MSRCCQTPLVSVVVPIYNVEPYLRECVDSILAQTYQNIEIILVDDGATDGCPGICDEYDSKYPNVTAVHKLNGGLSDARNAGLALAKGEFVTFVDSDDWLAPQMIERCESLIRKYDADVCGVSFMKAFPGGKFHKNTNFASGPECYNNVEALAKYLFNTNLTVCVWGKLWRRSLWSDIRCPKGLLHEDQHTTYRLIDASKKVVFDPEPLYFYRQREGSIGHTSFSDKSYDLLDGVDAQYDYISGKYPEIEGKIGAACSFWYCVFINMMLRSGHRNDAVEKRCQNFVRRHLIAIAKSSDMPTSRKAQLGLFALSLPVYKHFYLEFISNRG